MMALFLAAFSLTLVLQPSSGNSAVVQQTMPATPAVVPSTWQQGAMVEVVPGGYADELPPAVQWEPTLGDLVADPDPGTSAEAQALLALLDEESRVDLQSSAD
jgi:hypothetical protein